MKSKISEIVTSNNTVKILSIVIAFVCWLFVASVGNTVRNGVVKDVPLDLSSQERLLSELGLNIIEISSTEVEADISGERVAVGKVTPGEVAATVKIPSTISDGETEFELPLVPLNAVTINGQNYEVVGYKPATVKIKLDSMETKTFPIEADIDGDIEIEDEFIQQKSPVIDPANVKISGPKLELEKIKKAVVSFKVEGKLSSNYTVEEEIVLYDIEGNVINKEDTHLVFDNDTARVVIPVLKQKKLPLTVEFINIPRNFPKEKLEYSSSSEEILLAGDAVEIDKYSQIVLGYVDISQLSKMNNSFTFEVDIPGNFENLENIKTATVTFDTSDWEQTSMDIADINISNPPDGYNFELITDSVSNVIIVGEKAVIEGLEASDLVAEINFADKKEISVGQFPYPVKISAPAKNGLVWVYGEYNIIIKVEKNEDYS